MADRINVYLECFGCPLQSSAIEKARTNYGEVDVNGCSDVSSLFRKKRQFLIKYISSRRTETSSGRTFTDTNNTTVSVNGICPHDVAQVVEKILGPR